MSLKRILIVEDDPSIAETLDYNLKHEGYETRVTEDGSQALSLVRQFQPDLVVLDIMLPGMNGFDVCRHLKSDEQTAKITVVMLTVRSNEADVVLGLELGAEDYVTKPFKPRILLARIRNLLRREKEVPPDTPPPRLVYRGLLMDLEKREALIEGTEAGFSKTEFEIVALLISKPGKVFSRQQILDSCWPSGVRVVDRSVDVHMNSIRKKIKGLSAYLETVRGVGYRFKEEDPA